MPSDDTVPRIDLDEPVEPRGVGRSEAIELRLLEADAKAKDNLNREADQRYFLRWASVVICVLLVIFMAATLLHVSHQLLSPSYFETSAALVVAGFVAPIVSMTVLAVSLLVASFRGFKGGDGKDGIEVAGNAIRTGSSIG